MKKIIKELIQKYIGVEIDDSTKSLLDIPVCYETWLYVILELEEKYHLPIIQVLNEMKYDEFNIKSICKKLEVIVNKNHDVKMNS